MRPTPSQTIGPFFHPGFSWLPAAGDGVDLGGVVLDGDGEPVTDAVLELWQPGRFVRAFSGPDGSWKARVLTPGPINVSIFARGLLQRLVTRIYLPDDQQDEYLLAVDEDRRATLSAVTSGDGVRFDVRLQGAGETVFFAW